MINSEKAGKGDPRLSKSKPQTSVTLRRYSLELKGETSAWDLQGLPVFLEGEVVKRFGVFPKAICL